MRIRCRNHGSKFNLILAALAWKSLLRPKVQMSFLLLPWLSPDPQVNHVLCLPLNMFSKPLREIRNSVLKTRLPDGYYYDAHFLGNSIKVPISWVGCPKLYNSCVAESAFTQCYHYTGPKEAKQLMRRASFHYQAGPGLLSREVSVRRSEWGLCRCLEDHSLVSACR